MVAAARIAACERLRRNGLGAETTAEIRELRGIHACCFTPRARGLTQVNRNVAAAGSNQLRRSSRIGRASGWPVFIFDHENHEFSGLSSARIGRLAMDIRGAFVERLARSESHGRRCARRSPGTGRQAPVMASTTRRSPSGQRAYCSLPRAMARTSSSMSAGKLMLAFIRAHRLHPLIEWVSPLVAYEDALRLMADGQFTGKIVLDLN